VRPRSLTRRMIKREDRPRVRKLRLSGAVLLVTAMFAGNAAVCAAATSTPSQEMACCKAGHRTCGQMTSASDCCKSRQHTAPTISLAKQTDVALAIALPASVPALFAFVSEMRLNSPVRVTLKRLHDPPHLHTFSLLI